MATLFLTREAAMAYPIKTCVICGEEFELKPDKPGYANRCPECSAPEQADEKNQPSTEFERQGEANEARRNAIRDMLYRKDS
jgi:DNA-directed RNA polymerase subunit RPC12/RpoP